MRTGHTFFHPVRQADFEDLLEGRPFLIVRGQLIFRSKGEVVITNIRPGLRFTAEGYQELPEGAPYQLIIKHGIKNAINPVITAVSGWLASLMAGAFFIEYIFSWKGIGYEVFEALT
ncbi:MAG: ABC transporter permease subunit, partial [Bacteroidetes bacterium]